MGSEVLRIEEPFGTCVVRGVEVKITPPHGLLSSRDYLFDRSQQVVTVTDRNLGIFSSKKNIEFPHISFGVSQRIGAAYCIEMFCRVPNLPLIAYELTGHCDSAEKLEPMKKAIIDGTGIDKWEGPAKT